MRVKEDSGPRARKAQDDEGGAAPYYRPAGARSPFFRWGSVLRNGGNMLLRTQKGVPDEFRFVDSNGRLLGALDGMLRKFARGEFKPLVRTLQAFHCGAAEFAADACMPQGGEEGGWGMVVGDVYAYGAWPEE